MREVWRNEMSLMDKQNEVPCKRKVHPHFSTSFGLHVTVLTADKPQEVLFFQRENTGKFILSTSSLQLFSNTPQSFHTPLSGVLSKFIAR